MSQTRSYKSKPRELILQALKSLQESTAGHATADDIAAALRAQGENIGQATVYRQLDKLLAEGLVLKYTLPGGARACYQYVEKDCQQNPHSHTICSACGQVFHLPANEIDALSQSLLQNHNFTLNRHTTVFFGLCGACANHKDTP